MNRQEQNKKCHQTSHISNSEIDRLNVASSQDTSTTSKRNLILPTNLDKQQQILF